MSQNNGMEVDAIIGDSAYSGKENLTIADGQNIKVVANSMLPLRKVFEKMKIVLTIIKMPVDLSVLQGIWRFAKHEVEPKM